MIAVRVRDDGALDTAPWIDMKIAIGTIEAERTLNEHPGRLSSFSAGGDG